MFKFQYLNGKNEKLKRKFQGNKGVTNKSKVQRLQFGAREILKRCTFIQIGAAISNRGKEISDRGRDNKSMQEGFQVGTQQGLQIGAEHTSFTFFFFDRNKRQFKRILFAFFKNKLPIALASSKQKKTFYEGLPQLGQF